MSTQPKKLNSAEIAKVLGLGDSINLELMLQFLCNILDIVGPLVLEKKISDTCAIRATLEKVPVVPGSVVSAIPTPVKRE